MGSIKTTLTGDGYVGRITDEARPALRIVPDGLSVWDTMVPIAAVEAQRVDRRHITGGRFGMRKVRYSCAMSLDGFIAGPNGDYDWIVMDPDFDFQAVSEQFDTYLLGRKTFEVTGSQVSPTSSGIRTYVFSRTLRQSDYKDIPIIGENWKEVVRSLRDEEGKDIWLFGGGSLFRSLADEGLVDTVEVAIVPVLLGAGVPLIAEPATRISLELKDHKRYEKTGTVSLVYQINEPGPTTSPSC